MNAQERLRQAIDQRQSSLRASVPPDRQAAILTLLGIVDQLPSGPGDAPAPDLITGRRLNNLGGNRALQLCLDAGADAPDALATTGDTLDDWAEQFLTGCDRLAEAELVMAHCETGFMGLVERDGGSFDTWIATKRPPPGWRERADIDWWAASLAARHASEPRTLQAERPDPRVNDPAHAADCRRLANLHLALMAYQIGYPPDAEIGGCTVETYRAVLGRLIAWALEERERGAQATPHSERALVTRLAAELRADPAVIGRAVAAFTVDAENATYHAAVPGVTAAPLVRVAPDRLAWSLYGLTSEPLFFLTRELRRREGQDYHNTAYLREDVFRQDLYALFADKRFVTSTGKIELRRAAGDVRTDIDAVVFDRKTGALAFFELKTQDPFAHSTAELTRQRDNLLYANRQISGALAWLNHNGADALLQRVDRRRAKTFRAHRVYPFVLGRYLAHFNDGPEPDKRAAWGTWPQVLRLLAEQPLRSSDANPLGSLFNRLSKDASHLYPSAGAAPREIPLGDARLLVHPSYAEMRR